MNTSINSNFLKEMGITEWVSRELPVVLSPDETAPQNRVPQSAHPSNLPEKSSMGTWWFFGGKPQGDAEVLFQNVIRILGLSPNEWEWKNPSDNLNALNTPANRLPTVAFAFGEKAAQKLSGERDPLPELRETVLALDCQLEDEIPLIASFDLSYLLSKPGEKALLWQDLLLARSVLQNI
jgi:DNA polymerase